MKNKKPSVQAAFETLLPEIKDEVQEIFNLKIEQILYEFDECIESAYQVGKDLVVLHAFNYEDHTLAKPKAAYLASLLENSEEVKSLMRSAEEINFSASIEFNNKGQVIGKCSM